MTMIDDFLFLKRLCSIASIKQSGRIPTMVEISNVHESQVLVLLYLTFSEAWKAGSLLPCYLANVLLTPGVAGHAERPG